jgi:hypothetical protein
VPVQVRLRIPPRGLRAHAVAPATISPLTQSVKIAVNKTKPQVFNTAPGSRGCTATATGTTCTFAVHAKAGTDTFAVTTYSAAHGKGMALDRGVMTVPIKKGKKNGVAIVLGPVVTTTADSGMGSLRYAIGSANKGDTIMFLLRAGSTITLASPISLLGTTLTIAGPGASKLTISGNHAHELFANTAILTISGVTLTAGNAPFGGNPGGAIHNVGELTLANDVVGNNTSAAALKRRSPAFAGFVHLHPHCTTTTAEAGAIYNNGTLVITGTTFTGNVVPSDPVNCIVGQGGAIFNDTNGTLSSTGDTYANNAAQAGGAILTQSVGQVTFTNDTFNGNTGCNATNGCSTGFQGEGAAIGDNGSGIVVTNSTFENNVAGGISSGLSDGIGGALLLGNGTPSITGSTFTNNLAGGGASQCSQGQGGAIATQVALELDNDTFKSNRAIADQEAAGGAVFGASANANITGNTDTFSQNSVNSPGSACYPNGQGIAGAVGTEAVGSFINSTFTTNASTANSIAAGAALVCDTCSMTDDTFSANNVLGTGAGTATSAGAGGGAVVAQTMIKATHCTFTANTATVESSVATQAAGGALLSNKSLSLSGNTFKSNSAKDVAGGGGSGALGGAIGDTQTTGNVFSSGDTFTSNTASSGSVTYGGAMYLDGPYTISNDTFSSNSVTGTQASGGAVALGTHSGSLTNDVFNGNSATAPAGDVGAGGAISDDGGATINGGNVTNNTASMMGGGIIGTGGLEGILGVSITGNKVTNASIADAGGGGIFDGTGVLMLNSTVANNTVTVSAGGWGGGGILNYGGLAAAEDTISGNAVLGTTSAGGGGGIFSDQGLNLENSTVSKNTSSVDGGGVMVVSNAGTGFSSVTFYQNTATGRGGNIDSLQPASLGASIVAGGVALGGGPDIYTTAAITSNDWNILQHATAGSGSFTSAADDLLATDPQLLPLANNGGPTFTNADKSTSPAKARIPYSGGCGSGAYTTDQRGFTRGAGGKCDVGAYEYAGVATAARRAHAPAAHFRFGANGRLPFVRAVAPLKFWFLRADTHA